MHSAALKEWPLVEWSIETFRLFPTRFPPVNVYEGLIANDRYDAVAAIEVLTNPRVRSLERLQTSADGGSANPRLQNWNLAPFAYGNPDGTIFFPEDRPCLEVATDRQTALAISVNKREVFLSATSQAPIGVDMRMLRCPVSGLFWDLREMDALPAPLSKGERYALGASMPANAQGIIYRPTERPIGTCIAIIDSRAMQRSQQSAHFRYVWDGKRISLLYVFDQIGRTIRAEELAGVADILAA